MALCNNCKTEFESGTEFINGVECCPNCNKPIFDNDGEVEPYTMTFMAEDVDSTCIMLTKKEAALIKWALENAQKGLNSHCSVALS